VTARATESAAENGIVAARGEAGGKLILLGEHAVVHGEPALALSVARSVAVDVAPLARGERTIAVPGGEPDARVRRVADQAARLLGISDATGFALVVSGDLPVAVGLGSSAALCVATVRALASARGISLDDAETSRHAHLLEQIFHGTPSGIDSTTATYGGLLWFQCGPPPHHEPVVAAAPFEVLIVFSGTRHDTAQTVGRLRERVAAEPDVYRPVLGAIGSLVGAARAAIERGDLPLLGALMTMNHALLRACGVSTPPLDQAVEHAIADGALGAKLTGGGGGGALIALPAEDSRELTRRLGARGYEVQSVRVAGSSSR
jgi:mevalonate kinase